MTSRADHFAATFEEGRKSIALDPAGAAARAREALARDPSDAGAFRLLGAALRISGDLPAAEQAELAAIRASSHNPILVASAAAMRDGRFADAEHLLRPFLRKHPDDAAALNMLAWIAVESGEEGDGEELLRQALTIAPRFVAAQLRLADLLVRQNRQAEAVQVLEALLQFEPGHDRARAAKASALAAIGEYSAAVTLYEALLGKHGSQPPLWLSYGHVLKTTGRSVEAVTAYRTAIRLRPDLGEAWWGLANMKTVTLGEDDVDRMRAAIGRSDLDENTRLHLHFALGKALEDRREIQASFEHYDAANRIRNAVLRHDPAWASDQVRRMQNLFTKAFLEDHSGEGDPACDPIFIVGMPRAGSTLIEQILASHSAVEGTSELPYIQVLARERPGTRHHYPEDLGNLRAADLRSLGEEYLRRAAAHRKTARPFFVDKLPNNWLEVGFIKLILPNARIIDARRHPLACCFSNYKQHFARGQAFAYAQHSLGLYYRDYVRLMRHFDTALPGHIHRVFHEDLIENPEREIRRLLGFLDLPFEDACLRFHENARAVRTPSAEQVRRPINKEGVDRWRAYEPFLAPLKQALGDVLTEYPAVPANLD